MVRRREKIMSKYRILEPEQSYTFNQYFLLPNPTIEIVAEFDYSYDRTELELPRYFAELSYLEFLQNYLQRNIKLFNPIAEISIREFLIAPILAEICAQTKAQLYSEYPINVNEKLKGTLDYYLHKSNSLLVIEAKQSDIRRGFTQLAVELIALDQSVLMKNLFYMEQLPMEMTGNLVLLIEKISGLQKILNFTVFLKV